MNKNGTDLTTKIEDLKQRALKSGNTFVIDMINSNKNPNDLFFKNMNKMMNKGNYHDDSNDESKTLYLDTIEKYNILNNVTDADNFLLCNNTESHDSVSLYKNIKINIQTFIVYLLKRVSNLFKIDTLYYSGDYNDIDYINILLNDSENKLKSKISDEIITQDDNPKSKKLGDKLKIIVLNYRVFIELIYFFDAEINEIELKCNNDHTFSLSLFKNNSVNDLTETTLMTDDTLFANWDFDSNIITNALNNKNNEKYDIYLDYLSNVIIKELLFLNIDDDILISLRNDDDTIDQTDKIQQFIKNNKTQLTDFILTTCLFIGKECAEINKMMNNIDKLEDEGFEIFKKIRAIIQSANENFNTIHNRVYKLDMFDVETIPEFIVNLANEAIKIADDTITKYSSQKKLVQENFINKNTDQAKKFIESVTNIIQTATNYKQDLIKIKEKVTSLKNYIKEKESKPAKEHKEKEEKK